MLLLCNCFQSWWAKILLVHIGYCLDWKKDLSSSAKSWLYCLDELSKFGFWISQHMVYQWYTRVLTAFQTCSDWRTSTIFWHNVGICLLFCVLSKSNFQQILKLWGFETTAMIYNIYVKIVVKLRFHSHHRHAK